MKENEFAETNTAGAQGEHGGRGNAPRRQDYPADKPRSAGSPRAPSAQRWRSDICVSACNARRGSNAAPSSAEPCVAEAPPAPGRCRVPEAPSADVGCAAPTRALGSLRHRRSRSPPSPACRTPAAQFPAANPGWVWLLQASPLVPFLVHDPRPPGTEACGWSCPVLRHGSRAERGAQRFCSSPGIVNRSGSDRVFSKH